MFFEVFDSAESGVGDGTSWFLHNLCNGPAGVESLRRELQMKIPDSSKKLANVLVSRS
eukprot:SAG31_NODE_220_length_19925_cov_3.630939_9_plen_58_part_00